jgi:ankyrin repeat protein
MADADVNVCTEASGDSPLHVAATNGQLSAVQALIECGANVNQTNSTGWTALHQVRPHFYCLK